MSEHIYDPQNIDHKLRCRKWRECSTEIREKVLFQYKVYICFRTSLANIVRNQSAPRSYRFEGNIQSMKWVQIREPFEFIAKITGTFIPDDFKEISIKGNVDSVRMVGLFFGTLTLPRQNNKIEKSPGKLTEEKSSGNKENPHADQQNEPKVDLVKHDHDEISNTVAHINIDIKIRSIEGSVDLVEVKGSINNGKVVLSDELLAKLYKVAKSYVGLDGDIHSVKEIQIEGVIEGSIIQNKTS